MRSLFRANYGNGVGCFLIGLVFLLLQGCFETDGTSGAGAGPIPLPPAIDNVPQSQPQTEQMEKASRLAARATFGLNYGAIEQIATLGQENWLAGQFLMPVGLHTPIVEELLRLQEKGQFEQIETDIENFEFFFRRLALWQQLMNAPDVLRQRIAFALSEIFVVSDQVDALFIHPRALSHYYDTLLIHSFGNFRDLLKAVTLHPAMGIYLSHVNNRKAIPEKNTFPDENYAREVMQLFSIGLFELNEDGSLILDEQGAPIATYSNREIREFAKIFTGLSFGGEGAFFGNPHPNFVEPMQMFDQHHEPGEKYLLHNQVVDAGQSGDMDIEDAIDNLFYHPNVGPFIGKQLIQRLVTSNPSPEYVARVAKVFNGEPGSTGDPSGVRGDMQAVIKAILLDPEANTSEVPDNYFGKLREPLLRYTSLLRQFNASSADGFFANLGLYVQELARQHPLSAPSVFNFYQPGYSPPGTVSESGLVAPEFQVTNSSSIVGISNLADIVLLGEKVNDFQEPPFAAAELDLNEYLMIAEDAGQLLDRLDLVMTFGQLSKATRSVIEGVIEQIPDSEVKVKIAIYLIFTSPDYAIRT